MANEKRNLAGNAIQDPSAIANQTYNEQAGAQKNMEVGRKLIPLYTGSGYTTNAATGLPILAGKNFAIWNNAATVAAVTFAPATVSALAAGATDAAGNVGIPCKPGDWTYVAGGSNKFIITGAATLMVFMIDDPSSLK